LRVSGAGGIFDNLTPPGGGIRRWRQAATDHVRDTRMCPRKAAYGWWMDSSAGGAHPRRL
jgi:hypothetical protein